MHIYILNVYLQHSNAERYVAWDPDLISHRYYLMFRYLVLLFTVRKVLGDAGRYPIELTEELGLRADVLRGKPQSFCYKARDQFNLAAVFEQVDIIVKSDENFNWHAVRGVSSDDFHSVIQKFVFGFFLAEEEKRQFHQHLASDDMISEKVSWIRDLLSSCPSPLGSMYSLNKCAMHFSPYGRACITVTVDHSSEIEIDTIVGFNIRLLLNLLCGIALFMLAFTFSKSKIFQVSRILCFLGPFSHNLVLKWLHIIYFRGNTISHISYC